ncbi:class I SAM-dependent methyltransferase [Alkalihalobacillus pseudalcaliphilus]|uniref:class I SAM-dependent methyltransferase n=1 Tax=Alkalihalobacillus pseudalcaliphilus TaxID=79884 RepID=UPI00064DE95D|nr:class I SAM-dependent methyltransferase [Alkalihalobacillus pseudalcaliphilus]KMK76637.1 methyltransferase [Alkalihalobacillus pseudalcaliphilus]
MNEAIYSYDDVLKMLDSLLREPTEFWDDFYSKRNKGVPFFTESPDENLVDYFEKAIFNPGKVLELGCGPGRNAIYFAKNGCEVDAVDLSAESIKWAGERAKKQNVKVNFIQQNLFDLHIEDGAYDMVYDSGCFHHIAPHRRMSYVDVVKSALKPNGLFAVTCFVAGGKLGGAELSDWEVYRKLSLNGGLGYTDEKLRQVFSAFDEVEIRKMKVIEQPNHQFGIPDFIVALFRKNKANLN